MIYVVSKCPDGYNQQPLFYTDNATLARKISESFDLAVIDEVPEFTEWSEDVD